MSPLPLLAKDWMDALPAVVMLLIVLVSWVINKVNEARQQAETRRRSSMRPVLDDSVTAEESLVATVEVGTWSDDERHVPSVDPENLSSAERIERTRAQVHYKQRVAQLAHRKNSTPESDVPQPRPKPVPQRPARPTQSPRIQQSRWPIEPLPKANSEVTPRIAPQGHTRRLVTIGKQPTKMIKLDGIAPQGHTRRLVTAMDEVGGAGLRRAIVLKEVLDRPLALRDPLEG